MLLALSMLLELWGYGKSYHNLRWRAPDAGRARNKRLWHNLDVDMLVFHLRLYRTYIRAMNSFYIRSKDTAAI